MMKRSRQRELLAEDWTVKFTDHVVARSRSSQRYYLRVGSRLEDLAIVQQWFQDVVHQFSHSLSEPIVWPQNSFDRINLAIAEGFTNAVRHAHVDMPPDTPVIIECALQPQRIEVCIFDQGEPFDPSKLAEPEPGTLREGGYGWFLIRRLVDEVTYSSARPKALAESAFSAKSVHPVDVDAMPSHSEIERVRNCLTLMKIV